MCSKSGCHTLSPMTSSEHVVPGCGGISTRGCCRRSRHSLCVFLHGDAMVPWLLMKWCQWSPRLHQGDQLMTGLTLVWSTEEEKKHVRKYRFLIPLPFYFCRPSMDFSHGISPNQTTYSCMVTYSEIYVAEIMLRGKLRLCHFCAVSTTPPV